MHAFKANDGGLPKYGPHGVLVSGPHGVTRDRILGLSDRKVTKLKAELDARSDELAKRSANRARAAKPVRVGQ